MALTGDYTQTATGSRIFGISRTNAVFSALRCVEFRVGLIVRIAFHNVALAGQLPEHSVARVKDVDDSETVPEPATFVGLLIESFAPEAVSDKLAAVPDVT